MRRPSFHFASLAAVTLAARCEGQEGAPAVAEPAHVEPGCFDVSLGDWTPIEGTHRVVRPRPAPPDRSGDSVDYALPPRLRLRAMELRRWPHSGWFLVTVPENALQVPHSFMAWSGTADSLALSLSTGYAGTISTLAPATDGWTGATRTFSDMEGIRFERPISLRRVDCASDPPVPASVDAPLPREVELRARSALVLGGPLPAGAVARPRRSGARTLEVEPSGIWAGADTVIVLVDDEDVVVRVELRYPRGFDASPLVRHLVREFGRGDPLPDSSTLFWRNRTTVMFAARGGSRLRVVIYDPR